MEEMMSTKLVDSSVGMDIRNAQALRQFLLSQLSALVDHDIELSFTEERRSGRLTFSSSSLSLMATAATGANSSLPNPGTEKVTSTRHTLSPFHSFPTFFWSMVGWDSWFRYLGNVLI